MIIDVNDVKIEFPYEAYECQQQYMQRVLGALQNVTILFICYKEDVLFRNKMLCLNRRPGREKHSRFYAHRSRLSRR